MGYLPEAMRNYLARLGWSHGDDEIFSTEQMVEWFSLEGLNKGAARFDFVKLENINGHYIREAKPDYLYDVMLATADEVGRADRRRRPRRQPGHGARRPARAAAARQDRAGADRPGAVHLCRRARSLSMPRPPALLTADAARRARRHVAEMLRGLNDWSVPAIDAAMRALRRSQGAEAGQGGAAAARGPDRPHGFARHFRGHGADRPGRKHGAA